MKLMYAAAVIMLSGCITIPEERREELRYREAERINRFFDYRDSCERVGGVVLIQTTGRNGRDGVPRHSDRYRCSERIPAGSGSG